MLTVRYEGQREVGRRFAKLLGITLVDVSDHVCMPLARWGTHDSEKDEVRIILILMDLGN